MPLLTSLHHRIGGSDLALHRHSLNKMRMAVQAICTAIQIKPAELLPGLLSLWWLAWENHPAYESYYMADSIGYCPPFSLL